MPSKQVSDEKLKAIVFGIIESAGGDPRLWEAYGEDEVERAMCFLRAEISALNEENDQ